MCVTWDSVERLGEFFLTRTILQYVQQLLILHGIIWCKDGGLLATKHDEQAYRTIPGCYQLHTLTCASQWLLPGVGSAASSQRPADCVRVIGLSHKADTMLTVVFSLALVAASQAIVCTPELCRGVQQKELNCQGELIKNGGFCGCTDICAGVSREPANDWLKLCWDRQPHIVPSTIAEYKPLSASSISDSHRN